MYGIFEAKSICLVCRQAEFLLELLLVSSIV